MDSNEPENESINKVMDYPKSVRETIIEKIMACGFDMFIACEEADRIISEFLASGKKRDSFGVMCGNGKCGDVITLERKTVKPQNRKTVKP